MTIINELDLDNLVLHAGGHTAGSDEMCIEEAAALAAGEDWSASPKCVSPVIAMFLLRCNDAWDHDARQTLKQWIYPQLGTNKGKQVDIELAWMAADWCVRTQTPALLRLAGMHDEADALASMQPLNPETVPSIKPVLTSIRDDARKRRTANYATFRERFRERFVEAFKAKTADADADVAAAVAVAVAAAAAADAAADADADAAADAAVAAAVAAAAAVDAAMDVAADVAAAAAVAADADADKPYADAWWNVRGAACAAARKAAREFVAERLKPDMAELQDSAHDLVRRMIEHAKAAA